VNANPRKRVLRKSKKKAKVCKNGYYFKLESSFQKISSLNNHPTSQVSKVKVKHFTKIDKISKNQQKHVALKSCIHSKVCGNLAITSNLGENSHISVSKCSLKVQHNSL